MEKQLSEINDQVWRQTEIILAALGIDQADMSELRTGYQNRLAEI